MPTTQPRHRWLAARQHRAPPTGSGPKAAPTPAGETGEPNASHPLPTLSGGLGRDPRVAPTRLGLRVAWKGPVLLTLGPGWDAPGLPASPPPPPGGPSAHAHSHPPACTSPTRLPARPRPESPPRTLRDRSGQGHIEGAELETGTQLITPWALRITPSRASGFPSGALGGSGSLGWSSVATHLSVTGVFACPRGPRSPPLKLQERGGAVPGLQALRVPSPASPVGGRPAPRAGTGTKAQQAAPQGRPQLADASCTPPPGDSKGALRSPSRSTDVATLPLRAPAQGHHPQGIRVTVTGGLAQASQQVGEGCESRCAQVGTGQEACGSGDSPRRGRPPGSLWVTCEAPTSAEGDPSKWPSLGPRPSPWIRERLARCSGRAADGDARGFDTGPAPPARKWSHDSAGRVQIAPRYAREAPPRAPNLRLGPVRGGPASLRPGDFTRPPRDFLACRRRVGWGSPSFTHQVETGPNEPPPRAAADVLEMQSPDLRDQNPSSPSFPAKSPGLRVATGHSSAFSLGFPASGVGYTLPRELGAGPPPGEAPRQASIVAVSTASVVHSGAAPAHGASHHRLPSIPGLVRPPTPPAAAAPTCGLCRLQKQHQPPTVPPRTPDLATAPAHPPAAPRTPSGGEVPYCLPAPPSATRTPPPLAMCPGPGAGSARAPELSGQADRPTHRGGRVTPPTAPARPPVLGPPTPPAGRCLQAWGSPHPTPHLVRLEHGGT
ncbi:nascent polypeptide-associated complex subunit alpha, muscle-specific form-like [Hippopotamus amphibius kiboko]|uniref:nascent polypeptide-associated complex subunit alpha, muscle-specific form-like n=1 Tax=Hippopotamus amphibius kiboko TaxID=575201 RepID=UPI0025978B3F|nr:nascent polypeptide-associated complex subunit alpha, muscle-specific form-like [Hippopotamus amphibius kiboko]